MNCLIEKKKTQPYVHNKEFTQKKNIFSIINKHFN
jgi:hypothetical protein